MQAEGQDRAVPMPRAERCATRCRAKTLPVGRGCVCVRGGDRRGVRGCVERCATRYRAKTLPVRGIEGRGKGLEGGIEGG